MEEVDPAIQDDRNLAGTPSDRLKFTYGLADIRQVRASDSAYLSQQKTVKQLAKKSASELSDNQGLEEERKKRAIFKPWQLQPSFSRNGRYNTNDKAGSDGKYFSTNKDSTRPNYSHEKRAYPEADRLKEQLEALAVKFSTIIPDENISNFEVSLNEIEVRIKHKWSFGGIIYAPKQVKALYEEVSKLIDNSGSRTALNKIHTNIKDIEDIIQKVHELRSIQDSLLTTAEPKLKTCKNDLDNYARIPASQDKIKAKLYDLMTLLEIEENLCSPNVNQIDNWITNQSQLHKLAKKNHVEVKSTREIGKNKRLSKNYTVNYDEVDELNDGDLVINDENNNIELTPNPQLAAIQNIAKEIGDLKFEVRELRVSSKDKEISELAPNDEHQLQQTKNSHLITSDCNNSSDDPRFKDIESQLSRLSDIVDLLVVSLDTLDNTPAENETNTEFRPEINTDNQSKIINKSFTDSDILFFNKQRKLVDDKTKKALYNGLTTEASIPIKTTNIKSEYNQHEKTRVLDYFWDLSELENHRIPRLNDLVSSLKSIYKDNFNKLALGFGILIFLYTAFKIFDLADMNNNPIKSISTTQSGKIDNIADKNPSKKETKIVAGKKFKNTPILTQSQDIIDKSQARMFKNSPSETKLINNIDNGKHEAIQYKNEISDNDKLDDFNIGQNLLNPNNKNKDILKAIEYLKKAARKGYVPAEYRLGLLYEKGEGIAKNYTESRNWYEAAAEHGNMFAMHNLASMIAEGRGEEPNYTEAANWFEKASKAGMKDSQYNLGVMYARGIGVTKNYTKSYYWFALAARQGDVEAAKKRDEISSILSAEELKTTKKAVDNIVPNIDKQP